MYDHGIDEDMKLCVKRGAHWMDENHPGWAEKIDFNTLDMSSCALCIIGQAVQDTFHNVAFEGAKGWDKDLFGEEWDSYHGFDIRYDPYTSHRLQFRNLEIVWTEEVLKRLG